MVKENQGPEKSWVDDLTVEITPEMLEFAFNVAECRVAEQFNGRTCSMKNKDGNDDCPICWFRAETKRIIVERQKEFAEIARNMQ